MATMTTIDASARVEGTTPTLSAPISLTAAEVQGVAAAAVGGPESTTVTGRVGASSVITPG